MMSVKHHADLSYLETSNDLISTLNGNIFHTYATPFTRQFWRACTKVHIAHLNRVFLKTV